MTRLFKSAAGRGLTSSRPGGFRPRASLRTGLVGHTSGSLGSGLSGRTMLSGQRPVQPTCVGFTGAEIVRGPAVRYVQQEVSAGGCVRRSRLPAPWRAGGEHELQLA